MLRFSVITPSYNQGRYIVHTINSVLQQKYPNIEHIVIDGGSTDETVDILRNYSHLKWVSEADRGQSDAFNKGLKIATGDIIAWVNSDDMFYEKAFDNVSAYFESHPDVSIVYGNCYYIDESNTIIRQCKPGKYDYKKLMSSGYLYFPQMSAFIRKGALDKLPYCLDENLHFSMDYDLFLRLAKNGETFGYIDSYLACFRRSKDNKTSASLKAMRGESFAVSKKYGGDRYVRFHINKCTTTIFFLLHLDTIGSARKVRYRLSLLGRNVREDRLKV